MKSIHAVMAASVLCFAISSIGANCTPSQIHQAEQAMLSASQIACIFATGMSDSAAVADACAIDKALLPVLEQLISVKQAAAKAGVSYHDPLKDAGADAK